MRSVTRPQRSFATVWWATSALALCVPAVAPAAEPGASAFRLTLDGAWLYGPVDGQLQTPSGGRPGTTSKGRPTLDELGIDDASIFDASAILAWRQHELYLGGQWIRLSGDATLDQTLISQGSTFPAGSTVDSDVQLDWYRVGYRYRLDLGEGPAGGPQFVLWPSIGAAFLDFSLEIDGSTGARVDRSYTKGAPQVGTAVEWRATERFSVVGEVSSTLPFSNMPLIFTAELSAKYRVIERNRFSVAGFVGAAYELIYYEDEQQVPNDIEVDLGPLLLLGIEIKF